jgi:hypothetical protein
MCCIGTLLLMATVGIVLLPVVNAVRRLLGKSALGRASLDWERPVLTSAGEPVGRSAIGPVPAVSSRRWPRRSAAAVVLLAICLLAGGILAGRGQQASNSPGEPRVTRSITSELPEVLAGSETVSQRGGLWGIWCSAVHPDLAAAAAVGESVAETVPRG